MITANGCHFLMAEMSKGAGMILQSLTAKLRIFCYTAMYTLHFVCYFTTVQYVQFIYEKHLSENSHIYSYFLYYLVAF